LFLDWLVSPELSGTLERGRAGFVIVVCLSLITASLLLVLTWFITRDLQRKTVGVTLGLAVLFTLSAILARNGNIQTGALLLIVVLGVLVSGVVYIYGVSTVVATGGYLLIIMIAAITLGGWPCLVAALVASALVWLAAWGEIKNWYKPLLGRDISHLTFNAPVLTVFFLIAAGTLGVWSDYLAQWINH